MNSDLQSYYNNFNKPWSKLYYLMVREKLSFVKDMKVLDFGSGFGVLADILAKDNDVTSIEPNTDMVKMAKHKNKYIQLSGSIEKLLDFNDETFDVVVCHNVLVLVKRNCNNLT
ncbi:MAG: hypothetical protein A2Y17_11575 [Clostridiales bacterium GWF2_38_85]|nr:MAG: hypothetical protein A2Y17_11575 [Clostridiales bacterium GWF2_38_85]